MSSAADDSNEPRFRTVGICHLCARRIGLYACEAFPTEIPPEILTGEFDHSQPYPGDRGLQFQPKGSDGAVEKTIVETWAASVLKNLGWAPGPNAQWRRVQPAVATPTDEMLPATETRPSPTTDGQPDFARDVPRFKTKDEAYQWLAKNVGVRSVSDDRLSLEELQELADGCYAGIRDFQKQVPAMAIKTTGAGKHVAAWREDNTLLLNHAYRKNQAARDAKHIEHFKLHRESVLKRLNEQLQTGADPARVQVDIDVVTACTRWAASTGAAHPIETTYAHEMGHRLLGKGGIYWAWEKALRDNAVTRLDQWAVSEYGATSGSGELFAEVHAMVSTGREGELPASVLKSYRDWLAATYRKEGS